MVNTMVIKDPINCFPIAKFQYSTGNQKLNHFSWADLIFLNHCSCFSSNYMTQKHGLIMICVSKIFTTDRAMDTLFGKQQCKGLLCLQ